jgi:methylmalonyl-CoA mutase N-terminal domain/subunit
MSRCTSSGSVGTGAGAGPPASNSASVVHLRSETGEMLDLFPFTHGIPSGLYRDAPWVMGMHSSASRRKETNARIRRLLASGQ